MTLNSKHLTELFKSGIDRDFAELNFQSISGSDVYSYLCYSEKLERRNDGRLAQKWLNRYSHCEAGGWWTSGLDPLNDWQPMEWGCFKPDQPKEDYQKPGKFIKYEHPAKVETRVFFLQPRLSQSWRITRKQEGEAYEAWFQRFRESAKIFLEQGYKGDTEDTATSGYADSSESSESTSVRELYQLAERGEYSEADKLLQAVWNRSADSTAELGCVNPRGIERLGSLSDGKGFWESVISDKNVPIVISEGAKKTGCLLNAGYAAIALPGIFNGYRSKDAQGNKIIPQLIPDLQAIAQKGRPIYICFDRDEKPQTVRNVNIATSQLGWLFKAQGCEVKVISLPGPEKGVDDLIVAQGVDAFAQLYRKAKSLLKWQIDLLRQLTYKPDVVVSTKYIGSVDIPHDAKLIAFKAPKGSGKTETITQLCEEAYQQDQPVIVLTYREQLGRELARRFKLPYKTELKQTPEGTLYGFALCVDSAHPESEVGFTADIWADALVVIDEIESVTWHLLNSSTCTKNRLPILKEVQALFTGALSSDSQGRVVVADADLSDLTLNFVKGIAGQPDLKPYLIQSDYKPVSGWTVFNYKTPMDLYDGLIGAIEGRSKAQTLEELIEEEALEDSEAGKHIVFTSGQTAVSKWGTKNLEKDLQNRFPDRRILRIDKETVADPNHPAYGCIDNLNAVLPAWDVIIASPVIESGVSINLHNHFAGVWSFSSGVIPTDNVRQTLARLRDNNVPRHIWASDKGLPSSFVGNGSTSPAALRYGELKKSKVNFQALIEASIDVDIDGSIQTNTIALSTWLKMACRINAGFHDYRDTILADLELEGHSITKADSELGQEGESLSESMAKSRDELKESEAQKVVEARPPQSEAEYQRLKNQKTKTPEQRRSQLHYELQQRYLAPPDVDTVLKDWDGWYPHLRLHYYLTVGNEYLSDRDTKRFEDIAQSGRSWIPDTNRVLLSHKVKALKALGIDRLFVPGVDWNQDAFEVQEIAQKALACARDVKLFFGVTVTPKNSPMAVVQEILAQSLGLRLERPPQDEPQFIEKGTDANGKRQRARIYNFLYPEDRIEIFDRWLLRDAEAANKQTVSSSEQMDHQTHIDLINEFSDPKPDDPSLSNLSPEQETVSSSEQMDHQTHIDLIHSFDDPKVTDPSSSDPGDIAPKTRKGEGEPGLGWEAKPTPIPQPKSSEQRWAVGQRVRAWLGVGQRWEEATVLEAEIDSTRNFFKVLVQFFNLGGATQYVWEPSCLSTG